MSQQAMRQAARRSALDAQAVLRKERADRERRLERLAVAVLTALGERDAAVRDAERRAGAALQTMTNDEGLSLGEAVEWCGSGSLTVREVTRLRQLAHDPPGGSADQRATRQCEVRSTGRSRGATSYPGKDSQSDLPGSAVRSSSPGC